MYKLFIVSLLLLLFFSLHSLTDEYYQRIITVGGDHNYPPFEYLDDTGEPTGFNVELIKAIAQEMGLTIEIKLGPWHEVRADLEANRIDALIGMFYSLERSRHLNFSRPHSTIEMSAFIRKGQKGISTLSDLKDKRIIVQTGDIMHDYATKNELTDDLILVETPGRALELLAAGEGDAALLNLRQAQYLKKQKGITNIKPIPEFILSQEYCFASYENNRYLIGLLNEGLMNLKETSKYQEIYDKWLGSLEPLPLTSQEVFRKILMVMIPVLLVFLLIVFWLMSLKTQVKKRTRELSTALEAHKITASKLEESRNRYQQVVDNLSEVVFETDPDGNLLFVSSNVETIFKYNTEETVFKFHLIDLLAKENATSVKQLFSELKKKKNEKMVLDLTALRKDGSSFPARIYAKNVSASERNVGVNGIIIDLTTQKKAELTQEAMYKISESAHTSKDTIELFERIHEIIKALMPAENFFIALHDKQANLIDFPYYIDKHDPKPEPQPFGNGFTDYILKTGVGQLLKKRDIDRLVEEKKVTAVGAYPKVWLGVPLIIDGEAFGVIVLQDYENSDTYDKKDKQILTFVSEQIALAVERKQYQESREKTLEELDHRVKERTSLLRKSEATFRNLTTNSIDVIMRFDKELKHTYVNPVVEKQTGMKPEEFIGKTHSELGFPEELTKTFEDALNYVFKTGKIHRVEFKLPSDIWIDWHLVPELDEHGYVNAIITTAHDITERKLNEQKITKLNAELELRVQDRTSQLEDEIIFRRQSEKIQRTMYLISESLNTTHDIDELYPKIHEAVKELLPAKNFCIALYDRESDIIRFPYNVDDFDPTPQPKKPGNGLTEYVLKTGTAFLAREEELQKMTSAGEVELIGAETKVWLGIPLKIKDETVGVMMVQDYKDPDTYSEDDKQLLTFVSEQIALAIERKESEYETDLQRIYFEQLFDNIPAGIVMVNPEDRVIACNSAFTELFGYQEDEILDKKINRIIVSEETKKEAEQLSAKTQRGEVVECESIRKTKNGESRYVKIFGIPVIVDGKHIGIYGIYLDITDLHKAHNLLFSEKEKLSVMLSSIGDGVIATDVNSKVVLMNSIASDLTGWELADAEGKNIEQVFDIINESTRQTSDNIVEKVLETQQTVHLANHTVLVSKDGSERTIEDSAAPIKDKNGDLIGVILVFRDVTEKKRIEDEMQKNSKLETIGILAGGIAHDFNNILTAIMGNITLAKTLTMASDPKVYERLVDAERASIRAKDLTQQLLTFSKGGDPIKKTASVKEIITEACSFATHGSNVNCSIKIPDELPNVVADSGQIGQVINNIIINAVQAMPKGGNIYISAISDTIEKRNSRNLKEGSYVKITVRDTGSGISKTQLAKIFDPFYTTKKDGSGLGLTTSHNIIKKHDGCMCVDSEIGKGTTFSIWIPATERVVESVVTDTLCNSKGKGRILVMDDDEDLVEVVCEMLDNLGYDVVAVNDGQTALETYKKEFDSNQRYDAVILDLTIPGGMGGKDTIRELLAIDKDAQCIVSSGYSADPVMANYKDYGFKAVLSKPYSLQELSNTLYRLFNK
jgi:PAS domain S-box-containing protein